MRPRIVEKDVKSMQGNQEVEKLQEIFRRDWFDVRESLEDVPEWLKEQDEEEYKERVDTLKYHKYVQGEMSAWLSSLKAEGLDEISSDDVRAKYEEFKSEFKETHPGCDPAEW